MCGCGQRMGCSSGASTSATKRCLWYPNHCLASLMTSSCVLQASMSISHRMILACSESGISMISHPLTLYFVMKRVRARWRVNVL